MRVVFLHIPKTAGQSVHAALQASFDESRICPARVNEQLKRLSIAALQRYQVFSGHFDWNALDCLKGPTYRFTILRDPLERILSFYFFLRRQGERLSPEERAQPQNQGVRAAFELSPDDYFTGGPPHLRNFLDEHYDNFYTYYFAGRSYRGRSDFVGLVRRGAVSRADLLGLALDNIAQLDDVFCVDDMAPVFATIRALGGKPVPDESADFRSNVNAGLPAHGRLDRLKALGATEKTLTRIAEWCELDQEVFQLYQVSARPQA